MNCSKRCKSPIERHLLRALYPELGPDTQKKLQAQHLIDYYAMPVTLPDFAFPDLQIAIYCDGYKFHWERDPFQKDRQQSRDLQLQGWCVLRFAGREILNETDAVVRTIEQAIRRKARGTGGSRETTTDAGATPNTSYRRSIRSGAGRGGSVDDTGRVPFPHTFLSFDLWLIALFFDDSAVNSTTFRNRLRDAKKAAAEMEADGKVVIPTSGSGDHCRRGVFMKAKDIVLGCITLGLCISLLADMILHYLPDNTYVLAIITIFIVCILILIFGREGSTKSFLANLWRSLAPRKTIKLIPRTTYKDNYRWSNAEVGGEPAMQVHGEWHVTNLIDESVRILDAYLVKPKTPAILLAHSPKGNTIADSRITPGNTIKISVLLWIKPLIGKAGESFKGTLIFIDQFGNKHKVKATFESRNPEGELILSIKLSLKCQDELNHKCLPKAIRKKLKRKGVSLSDNLTLSVQDTKWVIKDPEKPRLVYTAKIEDKRLNLYKRFIPPL